MRFTFIAAKKAEHTVTILCRCLRVTRSGFYAWQRRPESTHTRDDRRLTVLVRASFEESKQVSVRRRPSCGHRARPSHWLA